MALGFVMSHFNQKASRWIVRVRTFMVIVLFLVGNKNTAISISFCAYDSLKIYAYNFDILLLLLLIKKKRTDASSVYVIQLGDAFTEAMNE